MVLVAESLNIPTDSSVIGDRPDDWLIIPAILTTGMDDSERVLLTRTPAGQWGAIAARR